MAEVKWIKIVTDIFDDEKILMIENLPDRDSIIVIWFKLLCMAGKQNNSGVFLFNDRIPYTDEMLATIFRRPLNTVRLALKTFEEYGMIEIVNNTITIPKWEKHQSLDALENSRKQARNRVAKYREKQKEIACNGGCNVTGNVTEGVTVTLCNADRIRIEEDIEEDIEKDNITLASNINKKEKILKEKMQKHKFGEFKHVLLTDAEYTKLCEDFGQDIADKYIQKVDEYCEMKGKSYKNYNLAIRNTFMSRDNVKPLHRTEADLYKGLTKDSEGFYVDKDGNRYV